MESWWFGREVEAPARRLLGVLPVGGQTVDPDECGVLAVGVEGLFRSEVASQYEAWPAGVGTDGTVVYLVSRTAEDTIEAVGLTFIAFDGCVFPSRVVITMRPPGVVATGFIGEVDEQTGEPPRLARGTILNAAFDDLDRRTPTVIVGHREVQPRWTPVFRVEA